MVLSLIVISLDLFWCCDCEGYTSQKQTQTNSKDPNQSTLTTMFIMPTLRTTGIRNNNTLGIEKTRTAVKEEK